MSEDIDQTQRRLAQQREASRRYRERNPRAALAAREALCAGCGATVVRRHINPHHPPKCPECQALRRGEAAKSRERKPGAGKPRTGAPWVNQAGYVELYRPGSPYARKDGSVLEHRHIMSEQLGRPLLPGETVHHRNGARADNRPDNLQLMSSSHPSGQAVEDKVAWALELLALYAPGKLAA